MELGTEAVQRSFGLRSIGGAIRLESLFVLILLIVALSVLSPYFLSVSNALNILLATSVIGILGFASTFVIAAAGIDLSVGSVFSLTGMMIGLAMASGYGAVASSLAGLAVGLVFGAINGALVTLAGLAPFVVTLITYAVAGSPASRAGPSITRGRVAVSSGRRVTGWIGNGARAGSASSGSRNSERIVATT